MFFFHALTEPLILNYNENIILIFRQHSEDQLYLSQCALLCLLNSTRRSCIWAGMRVVTMESPDGPVIPTFALSQWLAGAKRGKGLSCTFSALSLQPYCASNPIPCLFKSMPPLFSLFMTDRKRYYPLFSTWGNAEEESSHFRYMTLPSALLRHNEYQNLTADNELKNKEM